jgi:hypothetical protein
MAGMSVSSYQHPEAIAQAAYQMQGKPGARFGFTDVNAGAGNHDALLYGGTLDSYGVRKVYDAEGLSFIALYGRDGEIIQTLPPGRDHKGIEIDTIS